MPEENSSNISAKYNHLQTEQKWKKVWEEQGMFQKTYADPNLTHENKEYLLFAFAYPSGSGLHVGHMEPYVALDIMARFYRMQGKKVFFPVGWDAFGLPAENYAVQTGIHPEETTKAAIKNFRNQLKTNAISKDWETEIATCHPEYYKWTQWMFLELFKAGKAYKKTANVNWCPSCRTVLANEQVVDGHCERCDTEVVQKEMEQWFFKITDYKDELIEGLEKVDWPNHTKQSQINWIGKSEGARIKFEIDDDESGKSIEVFTTRPDTIYGATYLVLAPEHPLVAEITGEDQKESVAKYIEKSQKKTEEERMINKEKTGVFTGSYAVNPISGEKIPVWIADYVLTGYGTGAIMAVPAHDDRDYAFAKQYDLPITEVVHQEDEAIPYVGEGEMINSGEYNGMESAKFREKIIEKLENDGAGRAETTYKLRDWLISRQRYWGAPIPIVYDPNGKAHPVKDDHLPWELPKDADFEPTGESPLKRSKEFKERVEKLYGKGWTPEYDTMDTFVDSSWYYLRFTDPRNTESFASKEQLEKIMPVDFYMIGPEHTVLHLLYSRFFTKFLRDRGYLNFDEPFIKMRHQGMILGPGSKKMSKSKGNVINPDEVINDYGSDTLRMYEMFMGPIDADKPWDTNGVVGVRRFLGRIWNLAGDPAKSHADTSTHKLKKELHKTMKKVGEDIPALKFNTAIAKLMEFVNVWEESGEQLSREDTLVFIQVLAPFAPFISEEIYNKFRKNLESVNDEFTSVHVQSWPEYDEALVKDDTLTIVVQINGKVRETLENIPVDTPEEDVKNMARDAVAERLKEQVVKKEVYVPKKLVNFVV